MPEDQKPEDAPEAEKEVEGENAAPESEKQEDGDAEKTDEAKEGEGSPAPEAAAQ